MATIALADSIFPAGMGISPGIAKYWQDAYLGEGKKEMLQATFWLQMSSGNGKPKGVPKAAAHRATERS